MINKNNLVIANLFDGEKSQFGTQAVLVKKDKTVVNNGRILIEATRPDVDEKEFPTIPKVEPCQKDDFMLPVKAAKEIMSIIPNGKTTNPILRNAVIEQHDNQRASFSTTDLETARTVHTMLLEGKYPKYEEVYPNSKPVLTIGLSSKLLARICSIVQKFQTDEYEIMKFEFYDEKQAVKFSTINSDTEQKLQGLLMPMNLESVEL